MDKLSNSLPNRHLLKDRRAVDEINRHLWIESEKAGHDIGFDKAAEDWLKRFSNDWLNHHLPRPRFSLRNLKRFLSRK